MIKFLDLKKINVRFESEFKNKFSLFLNSGKYILSDKLQIFESEFAKYCGTEYCIGVASGLDAIELILKGYIELGQLKKGDHVIVPANTYIATILAIVNSNLVPVFIEPTDGGFNISVRNIERNITPKVKIILAVHLYGELADMKAINSIAKANNLLVIEDAAQAHGATNNTNIKAGNLSNAGAFSFYPSKNLGALGDGGAITTNDFNLFNTVNKLRNYGSSEKYLNDIKGVNSRLDELQAAFLSVKLKLLDFDNKLRRDNANYYFKHITNEKILLPNHNLTNSHVYHLFVIRTKNRDKLQEYLLNNGVQTAIHYPIPPHKQNALKEYSHLKLPNTEQIHNEVLSLPISPVQTVDDTKKIVTLLNKF